MTADRRPVAIALMGPTASGKTALAMEWAQRLNGEIVSVDSALVYRGLDIGAAKPDIAMQAAVRHHLIDVREPWQSFSAADFAMQASTALADIAERGKLPILAGGTGLYFRALLQGLAPMPEADAAVRAGISSEAEKTGWPALHARLASIDPDASRKIKPADAQRIQRALEVFRLTGKPISQWQLGPGPARLPFRVLKLVLAPRDRAVLHQRIERRFDRMLEVGLMQEVHRLRALPELQAVINPLDLPAVRAVGYRQVWETLDGSFPDSTLRDRAIFATRQLAKRQLTWLRGERDARWFDPDSDRPALEASLTLFLPPNLRTG